MAFEYMYGPRILVKKPLDSTSADITVGLAITASGATDGYFKEVDAAAEAVTGIAYSKVSSPSTDGGAYVMVDVSPLSVYKVAPDSGSVAVTIDMNTCDVGADGLTIDIDGSTTDDIIIVEIDADANTALVRLNQTIAGV
jgi:hypothetical protein